jgi:hypothetical protein
VYRTNTPRQTSLERIEVLKSFQCSSYACYSHNSRGGFSGYVVVPRNPLNRLNHFRVVINNDAGKHYAGIRQGSIATGVGVRELVVGRGSLQHQRNGRVPMVCSSQEGRRSKYIEMEGCSPAGNGVRSSEEVERELATTASVSHNSPPPFFRKSPHLPLNSFAVMASFKQLHIGGPTWDYKLHPKEDVRP